MHPLTVELKLTGVLAVEIDERFKVTAQLEGILLMNGELRGSSCDQWLESRCPATQELIGKVPNA